MHGGGKDVVGGLAQIDVIVGVNRRLAPQDPARQFDGPVGDHFVDVHIGLRAAAGHPDVQGKMVVQLALEDFLRGPNDQPGFICRQPPQFPVGQGRGLLDQGQGPDHLQGHQVVADGKVEQRPLGSRPPIAVRRDLDFSQAVTFRSHVPRFRIHASSPSGAVRMWDILH